MRMNTYTYRRTTTCYRRLALVSAFAATVSLMATAAADAQFVSGDIPVSGASNATFAPLDTSIKDFMVTNNVTAVTVAIMNSGRIVYERGFGWRDYYGGNLTPIKEDNVMRVASVTKPITAAAIQKLITNGTINAGSKVFACAQSKPNDPFNVNDPDTGILPTATYSPWDNPGNPPADSGFASITVQHLIQHRGGFNSKIFEPQFSAINIANAMGIATPPGPVNTVNYMLSQPLAFTPGATSGLCNNYSPGYDPAVSLTVGTNPRAVAIGDLDGNGSRDLATANNGSNDVSVVLSNGDGTFAAAVNYPAGTGPHSVAIADLNLDGKSDLVVANNGSDNVSVLLNNGDGTFAAAVNYGVGTNPRFVAIGDLNGDGRSDVVTANSGSNGVSVLINNGSGTFAAKVDYPVGTNPYGVAIGQLDGVNKADLVTANKGSDNVSVLLNNGNGTFATAVSYGTGAGPYSVAIANFDGVNGNDVVTANETNGNVSVLLNVGSPTQGTFATRVNYSTGGTNSRSVATGDLDGDGQLDIATSNEASHNVSVLAGNGDGTFGAATTYSAGTFPRSLAVGDLNGNGGLDIVTANSSSTNVWLLLHPSTGSYCYSNFGYMLLGLIIEQVTGQDYMDYVYPNFLATWGGAPREMFNGRTFKADQDPREPIYEPVSTALNVFCSTSTVFCNVPSTCSCVSWPYGGWEHEVFLGHGDLVTNTTQILNYASRYLMFNVYGQNPVVEIGTPLSGSIRGDHNGSITGTNALARQSYSTTVQYAIILNQRDTGSTGVAFLTSLQSTIDTFITDALGSFPTKYATDNWVDFASVSNGSGTFASPKNDLSDMLANGVQIGGRVKFKPGSGNWTGTISQAVKLDAPLGTVRIGQQ
jgi:CubicO group peptidase (beta-lactamase class C family)